MTTATQPPPGTLLERVVLPIELDNGNTGRGHKWFKTNAEKQRILRNLTALGYRRDAPYNFAVRLVVRRILGPGQRLWDASSVLRGNWKELEDALVNLGWFHDDSPKWIVAVDGRQDSKRRKDGPAVEIEIWKI